MLSRIASPSYSVRQDLPGSSREANAAAEAASAQQGVTLSTNEQLRLLREARDEWLSGVLFGEQYAERIKVALGGVDEALLKQQQALRDL